MTTPGPAPLTTEYSALISFPKWGAPCVHSGPRNYMKWIGNILTITVNFRVGVNKLHKIFETQFSDSQFYFPRSWKSSNNKHFESSQKLRKDGIGIWKNFIGNMLSNYILWFWLSNNTYYLSLHLKLCYLNWKWVESDIHFTCDWYIWNTVQNRKVISLNYDIWNEKEWTGTEQYT